jgi:diguanylate cyclase
MKYTEDALEAAQYLREAIPLMVKHKVHANPRNFALWYAYVSQQNNDLVQEIDNAIAEYQTCPDHIASDLFRRYIIDDEIDFGEEIQRQLAKMLGNLSSQTNTLTEGSDSYSQALEEGLKNIKGNPSRTDLQTVVKTLLEQTTKNSSIAKSFKEEIHKANEKINQLRQELELIQQDADLDPLTKLFNRRAFDKELKKQMQLSVELAQPLFMLIADLDHFKKCNDTYGHVIGDKIIESFAKILSHVCADIGFCARYGGEEFVVLLPNHPLDEAKKIAEKIRATTEGMKIKHRGSEEPIANITTSVGAAQYASNEDGFEFINRADKALYQAKEAGRNQIKIA